MKEDSKLSKLTKSFSDRFGNRKANMEDFMQLTDDQEKTEYLQSSLKNGDVSFLVEFITCSNEKSEHLLHESGALGKTLGDAVNQNMDKLIMDPKNLDVLMQNADKNMVEAVINIALDSDVPQDVFTKRFNAISGNNNAPSGFLQRLQQTARDFGDARLNFTIEYHLEDLAQQPKNASVEVTTAQAAEFSLKPSDILENDPQFKNAEAHKKPTIQDSAEKGLKNLQEKLTTVTEKLSQKANERVSKFKDSAEGLKSGIQTTIQYNKRHSGALIDDVKYQSSQITSSIKNKAEEISGKAQQKLTKLTDELPDKIPTKKDVEGKLNWAKAGLEVKAKNLQTKMTEATEKLPDRIAKFTDKIQALGHKAKDIATHPHRIKHKIQDATSSLLDKEKWKEKIKNLNPTKKER